MQSHHPRRASVPDLHRRAPTRLWRNPSAAWRQNPRRRAACFRASGDSLSIAATAFAAVRARRRRARRRRARPAESAAERRRRARRRRARRRRPAAEPAAAEPAPAEPAPAEPAPPSPPPPSPPLLSPPCRARPRRARRRRRRARRRRPAAEPAPAEPAATEPAAKPVATEPAAEPAAAELAAAAAEPAAAELAAKLAVAVAAAAATSISTHTRSPDGPSSTETAASRRCGALRLEVSLQACARRAAPTQAAPRQLERAATQPAKAEDQGIGLRSCPRQLLGPDLCKASLSVLLPTARRRTDDEPKQLTSPIQFAAASAFPGGSARTHAVALGDVDGDGD